MGFKVREIPRIASVNSRPIIAGLLPHNSYPQINIVLMTCYFLSLTSVGIYNTVNQFYHIQTYLQSICQIHWVLWCCFPYQWSVYTCRNRAMDRQRWNGDTRLPSLHTQLLDAEYWPFYQAYGFARMNAIPKNTQGHDDGFVQERLISRALAVELRLSYTKP